MTAFVVAAVALIAATLLLLLRPWRKPGESTQSSARRINAGIYRDQLAELERDLAAGTLAPADQAEARAELERRLLEDAARTETAPTARVGQLRRTSLALVAALPLLAAGLYAWLGEPGALDPMATQAAHQPDAGEVEQLVAALAARMAQQPDDPKGWAMLARSYRALGRLAEAEAAFERVGEPLQRDPLLLAAYADVLATRAGGRIEGRPLALATQALALDPDQPLALSFAATAAQQRGDLAQASVHWQHLLGLLPPESEDARWVAARLAETQGEAGAPTAAAKSVSGTVSLAAALAAKALPTDTVFVFARAAEGARMPLAVQRARVADLPLKFTLDDSMALSPQLKLSGAARVRVEARISRSGDATPAAGDLIGVSEPVSPGDKAQVTVSIDQVRP